MNVAPAARRGRPRSDASERAILDAALELMAAGSRPVTITEIARRAGVGKDTVYRRWRSKDDLLLDALATLPGPLGEHADGPIREVLIARLTELIERMHDDRNQRIYRSVLGGSSSLRERFFAELIERRRAATLRRDRGGGAARRAARRHRRRAARRCCSSRRCSRRRSRGGPARRCAARHGRLRRGSSTRRCAGRVPSSRTRIAP